ncbi:metallophosphoesterase [Falsiroseomonas selenitidurans]|uniref:Metallophosphoesterase n=1 Tax=Falsiroseomonas selenitidurans TaxID=2716335 RepID=A0ABX1E1L6_9PROT|nr:metallophosphoesterase [Falsiroseomonas selenitidurans]NKC30673.1 metallophosphoesterase [Falsiroseomonas selenitidurans]
MSTRRALLTTLGGLTVLGATTGLYGFWIEPTYRLGIAEYRLDPPGWPRGNPLSIVALADIHACEPQMPLQRVAEIVAAANALRPELVVLLGDYMGGGALVKHGIPVAETAAVLKGLRAPHGVHSVLGNHDWWEDPQVQRSRRGVPRTARVLADAGISVLHNAAVKTGFRGRGFWVAGSGSLWAFSEGGGRFLGANDLNRTLGGVQDRDPVILLCHEPDLFPSVPPDRVALTICGHTHGGQVRLAGYSPYVPSAFGNRYAYGHVVEQGRHLVVSGGLGTSLLPVRLGVPPEITLIRLGFGQA